MAKQFGKQEAALLAYVQMRKLRFVRTGDLTGPLQLSSKQESSLLDRMSRSKKIAQVRRGLYLVPPILPLGGVWTPDEALAINTLMDDRQGRYQICGPNAFYRYGFDGQVPIRLYAYNNRLYGERTIGAVSLTLIKVTEARLGGTEKVKNTEGEVLFYSSLARSLMDAVYDWSRFDSLPRGYGWIRREISAERVTASELATIVIRYGNQGTARRIGALLENLGTSNTVLRRLERMLRSNKSQIPFVPGKSKRGKLNRRWGVVLNEQS
jgi:predicted transcriptional regulator of viral defense system